MGRVLIIDDEESICKMLAYALEIKDIDTDIATNGRDGLDKFQREHFDVVITDLVMPGMDGNSVARQIRNSNKPTTPIVGMSGTAWLLDDHQFDVVFQKPGSIQELMDTVGDLLAPAEDLLGSAGTHH